nr:DUF6461 domain-containing protein [Streptomyces sp. NEAU-HV9]
MRVTGVEALSEPSYDDRLLAPVAAVGDRSLMVEYNGCAGITDELVLPVSRGRTVVSHFRNIDAVDHFHWFEDGDLTRTNSWPACGSPASIRARTTSVTALCTRWTPSRRRTGSRVCA